MSHWRKRLGDKLELLLAESLRVAHEAGALRNQRPSSGDHGRPPRCSPQGHHLSRTDAKLLHAAIKGSIPAGMGCSCGSHICASPSAPR